ncbi:MAG: DUF541 domain-containing protein [Chloroflexi bacterium]|nr:MAG: DUF541 domain-containing protein [Chloroflexota bacterium]
MTERQMTIQGHGEVHSAPDRAVLTFRASESHKEYETAVMRLNKSVEKLRQDLEWLGIKRTDLKTTNFAVAAQYDYALGKQRFTGFQAAHDLRLEIPFTQILLNQVLNKIANGQSDVEVAIHFEISQEEELKRQAIELAVQDAQNKAATIAGAAMVKLGKIVAIQYGVVEVRVEYEPQAFRAMAKAEAVAAAPDIQPQDIRAEETVMMTWEILD